MLRIINSRFRLLCSRLRWPVHRRSKPKVVIKKFGKSSSKSHPEPKDDPAAVNGSAVVHPNGQLGAPVAGKSVRIATFNAALFSMAPAIPKSSEISTNFDEDEVKIINKPSFDYELRAKSVNDRPKSILKQSPMHPNSTVTSENLSKQHKYAKSKLRVSINLPDNEISLLKNRQLSFVEEDKDGSPNNFRSKSLKAKSPWKSNGSFSATMVNGAVDGEKYRSSRTVLEVLRELDCDILALQDVKAEEEKNMKPLSDLAEALGMNYVFAESWAPEYGNAVFSKWPIKRWHVQKIFDDTDFRNILKATIDVPQIGEINFHCTHLDHLDENWRMKQINSIIRSNDEPHILAGGLNSLDETDYSPERWTDIVKYYEEMGKPTPKTEVMRFLKSKQYTDAKHFAGECEPVVMIAKGQCVQGTCKYGTRLDYIMASENSSYKFVPGSYSVFSSKGTSDHHIVKVDIMKAEKITDSHGNKPRKRGKPKQKVVKITNSPSSSSSSKGIWKTYT